MDTNGWEVHLAKMGLFAIKIFPLKVVPPHALKVDGSVCSTKPLSHQGTLIDNIKVRFEAGRIVEAHASRGEEVLRKVLTQMKVLDV